MKQIKMLLLSGIIMLTAATASMGNTAPVADAGPDQDVKRVSKIRLDGTASYDIDKKDELAYRWTFTRKPPGSIAEFTEAKEKKTSFTADIGGSYVIQLFVNDGIVDSDPDSVSVYVGADTTPPIITLNGHFTVMLTQGDSYTEEGATAIDDKDGNIDVTTSGSVDTATVGRYTLTYSAIDSAGNSISKNRIVYVILPDEEVETLPYDVNKIEGYTDGMDLSKVAGAVRNQYWIRAYNRLSEAELHEIVVEYSELNVVGYSEFHGLLVEIPEESDEAKIALENIKLIRGITSVRQRIHIGSGLIKVDNIKPDDNGSSLDDAQGDNWHLGYINMLKAWEITTGSEDIWIGVVDKGFYAEHEDIDFASGSVQTVRMDEHGTGVAGIIAADTNNSIGVSGINWKSKLIIEDYFHVKYDDTNHTIDYGSMFTNIFKVKGIEGPKIKLVNNSWADEYWDSNTTTNIAVTIENAIKYSRPLQDVIELYSKKLFIFAAGNDNMYAALGANGALHLTQKGHLQKKKNVIVVAALLKDGMLPAYSNYGNTVDIAAPAGMKSPKIVTDNNTSTYFELDDANSQLYGTDHEDTYKFEPTDSKYHPIPFNGTSAAAPVVTGVASLIYSLNPEFEPKDIKNILIKSSTKFATERHTKQAYEDENISEPIPGGYDIPILDAGAALQMAKDIINGKVAKVIHYYTSVYSPGCTVLIGSANTKLEVESTSFVINGKLADNTLEPITSASQQVTSFEGSETYLKYEVNGTVKFEGLPETSIYEEFENNIRRIEVNIKDKMTGEAVDGAKITVENLDSNIPFIPIYQDKILNGSVVSIYLEKEKTYKIHIDKEGYEVYSSFLSSVSPQINIAIQPSGSQPISSLLKKTGQTRSYNIYGSVVTDDSVRDDGYYQKGVTPSYTRDHDKEIVKDNITGLEWQNDAAAETVTKAWDEAELYCASLPLAGGGWRLPSRAELGGLSDYGRINQAIDKEFQYITNNRYYWSSTTSAGNSDRVWIVYSGTGRLGIYSKNYSNYVRCVRAGQ